jgi:hypothetical protein
MSALRSAVFPSRLVSEYVRPTLPALRTTEVGVYRADSILSG